MRRRAPSGKVNLENKHLGCISIIQSIASDECRYISDLWKVGVALYQHPELSLGEQMSLASRSARRHLPAGPPRRPELASRARAPPSQSPPSRRERCEYVWRRSPLVSRGVRWVRGAGAAVDAAAAGRDASRLPRVQVTLASD